MAFNIDVTIVVMFLLLNLLAGLYSGRNIKTIKEYAVGNRNFSTATIVATIIATWIGGGFFQSNITQTYKHGLWHIIARFGNIIGLLIVGYIVAPRVKQFFGKLSVAEVMSDLYGKNARIITAISSILLSVGYVAIQVKVISAIFSHFLGFSSIYATIISSVVIVLYSSFGGIKSVTFTDIIQFITFGIFLPTFALFIWKVFDNSNLVLETLKSNPLFDYQKVFNLQEPKFYSSLILLLYFTIANMDPAAFQRILMAKTTKQVRQSFLISAIFCLFIFSITCFIGVIALSYDSKLDPNNLVMYVIDNYSYTGLKGLTLIGIMAMVMSTADSYINVASVIFSHDLCKPLNINFKKDELVISRLFSFVSGVFAILLALFTHSLFDLMLLTGSFYTPIVSAPLFLAILGFRTSSRVVTAAMVTGGVSVVIWRIFFEPITGIDSIVPSTAANLIVLIAMHYILGEPGGWIGGLADNNGNGKKKVSNIGIGSYFTSLVANVKSFNIIKYCNQHLPKNDIIYIYFGFATLMQLIIIISLDKAIYQSHLYLINSLQIGLLLIAMGFICNKLWPENFRKKYMGLLWCGSIFVSLSYISSELVLISNFSQISLVIFILNFSILGILLDWKLTLLMVISGSLLALYSYQKYIGNLVTGDLHNLKLKITYVVFLVTSFMLTFLKPKQEQYEIAQAMATHLGKQVIDKNAELTKLNAIRNEILRNLEHEAHTPITGITSMGEVLWDNYDKLNDDQKRLAIGEIAKSSRRLRSLVDNLIDLSKLSGLNYKLHEREINLSNLVNERYEYCRRVYLDGKSLDFFSNIDSGIKLKCDSYYIRSVLDNLVINAIQYSTEGTITIELKDKEGFIEFSIQDEGIGIPKEEIYDIFESFTVSSRTKTLAGGRGIGLALCKKAIESHNGRIWAESEGGAGAKFIFTLPKNK